MRCFSLTLSSLSSLISPSFLSLSLHLSLSSLYLSVCVSPTRSVDRFRSITATLSPSNQTPSTRPTQMALSWWTWQNPTGTWWQRSRFSSPTPRFEPPAGPYCGLGFGLSLGPPQASVATQLEHQRMSNLLLSSHHFLKSPWCTHAAFFSFRN